MDILGTIEQREQRSRERCRETGNNINSNFAGRTNSDPDHASNISSVFPFIFDAEFFNFCTAGGLGKGTRGECRERSPEQVQRRRGFTQIYSLRRSREQGSRRSGSISPDCDQE